MIEIDTTRWRSPRPYAHQVVGARAIVKNKAFFIGDVPRVGKSRQVVDASCVLCDADEISLVLVVGPVAARGVWGNPELGQIKQYAWKRSKVIQLHARSKTLWEEPDPELFWVVTNYDILRSRAILDQAIALAASTHGKTMLVLDESSALGNHMSLQSKAVAELRSFCARCVMLNGTPGEPPKLYSQFNILDGVFTKRYKSFTTFKWRYAEWGPGKTVPVKGKNGAKGGLRTVHPQVGWKNLNKLSRIVAPYTLRRERADCPEIRQVPVIYDFKEVPLGGETWRMYRELKREALIELSGGELYLSPNAGVRLLRLAQICSGHLGGFEEGETVRDFSREKIDYLQNLLRNECDAKEIIVWCRWVREREILARELREDHWAVYELYGGQKPAERRISEMVFASGTVRLPERRYAMLAQPAAGGMALDMSAAGEVFRLSNDYSLKNWEQSNDRPLGPAQLAKQVVVTDVVATGPDGERTLDHIIYEALRQKRNLSKMTTAWWRKTLEEDS